MSFRARLVGAVTVLTVLTLGGAFVAIMVAVNGAQERQLDEALLAVAAREAREASALGGGRLAISDQPGPAANDVGPLTKYGAIYDPAGHVLAATPSFAGRPPALGVVASRPYGRPFDLRLGESLRAVVVPVPGHPGTRLLLAAPRADLDGDAAFLARAMGLVFVAAVAWSVLLATWIVTRLTRDHHAIAAVARRVAAGDFAARVRSRSGDPEVAQLAADIDDMVARLEELVGSQRRFIAHAAHELRSPLTTLYGELQLALRRARDPDAYRAAIEEALDATRRLKLLAEDLLALARLGAERDVPDDAVSARALLEGAAAAVRAEAAARGVALAVTGGGDDVATRGHARDLERMLRNLAENAVRHAPPGGRVALAASVDDDVVAFAVEDSGPGVPDADRERVFEPFFRGAEERAGEPGTGLGLAIAREIARQHGGDVVLEPAAIGGARFVARVPRVTKSSA